jgi:hypothetical protein
MVNLLLVNHTQSLNNATPQRTNQSLTSTPAATAKIHQLLEKLKFYLRACFFSCEDLLSQQGTTYSTELCDSIWRKSLVARRDSRALFHLYDKQHHHATCRFVPPKCSTCLLLLLRLMHVCTAKINGRRFLECITPTARLIFHPKFIYLVLSSILLPLARHRTLGALKIIHGGATGFE